MLCKDCIQVDENLLYDLTRQVNIDPITFFWRKLEGKWYFRIYRGFKIMIFNYFNVKKLKYKQKLYK